MKVESDSYSPDREEFANAEEFLRTCSSEDLASSWQRISKEWDSNSLIALHKSICESGRINDLVAFYSE